MDKRNLDINGPDQLKAFYYLAHSTGTLVAHLENLTVYELANDEDSEHHDTGNDIPVGDALTQPVPTYIDISTWPILSGLKSLSLHYSPRSLGALFEVAAAGLIIPKVKSLQIWSHSPLPGATGHFDEGWYTRLFKLLPALEEYEYVMGVDFEALPPPLPQTPPRLLSTQMRYLNLRFYRPTESEAIARLCNSLPNLQHLELREHEDPSTLGPPIIPLLALPGLRYFSFRASEGNDYGLQSPIDLRHFSRLQTVELGLGRCVASLDLALPQSTEVISISDHSDFPVAALKNILDVGSERFLPWLRRLELDIMELDNYGNCGRRFNYKQSVERRNPDKTFQPHKSWWQPNWSNNITYEGLLDLFELAAARNVSVDGRIFEAYHKQKDYNEYLDVIATAKAKWLATGKLI